MIDALGLRSLQSLPGALGWLRSLSSDQQLTAQPMYTLALGLCRRDFLLHQVAEGSGVGSVTVPPGLRLLHLPRPALLRWLLRAASAKRVRCPNWPRSELVRLLGGMAVSYAQERDLTIVAALVRFAGRLQTRDALLDEACSFLLDQQASDGAFGLFAAESAEAEDPAAVQTARLRLLVDIVSALSSYLDREDSPAANADGRLVPQARALRLPRQRPASSPPTASTG